MRMGFIGLGRMGFPMTQRLLQHKIEVVAYNRSQDKVAEIENYGAMPSKDIDELIAKLPDQKIIWIMLPAGEVTDNTIKELLPKLKKEDIIIDGANDFYENAEKHAEWCKKYDVHFFDCGVSGGVLGLENGYTLMIGGPEIVFEKIEPLCKALAPANGYGYFGPTGSGHFVKSVHNIIEYVYLQGLAEGVELLSKFKHPIQLDKATKVWEPASVIRSLLLELTTQALQRKDFNEISTEIGSVTTDELQSTKASVKGFTPAFDVAVNIRKDKTSEFSLGKRTIAAVRHEFGGHKVTKK
ncbi:6-phosphogluconate dehydrogenase [Candidatus Woesearchaeota archaeon CG10_big_fil_rev_8_21_14_0_10_32_9]|nr:MAG: 6-phosphogluconate dehydrogenase [Candidatus Woesearchaeota archaeon CG10_big_fil_rev_8_21_14_0_10_32_9]